MSGSLANRLVEAAERKLNELHSADGVVSYPTAARWATAAVLRELQSELERQNRERRNAPPRGRSMDGADVVVANLELARVQDLLLSLAGVVEGGEQE